MTLDSLIEFVFKNILMEVVFSSVELAKLIIEMFDFVKIPTTYFGPGSISTFK